MEVQQPLLPLDERFKEKAENYTVPRQLPLALEPHAPFSVDNFIISKANRSAFEMLEAWPLWPSPITVLIGEASSGKSHLAAVWSAQSYAVQCEKTKLDKAVDLASDGIPIVVEDIDQGEIDEIHLFHLINTIKQAQTAFPQASLLMTARTRPSLWNIQLPDLASRLRAVNLAEIGEADDTLLYAILSKLFSDRQLLVDADLTRFILNRSERSLVKLTETVDRIDMLALERKSKITRPLIIEALSNFPKEE